MLNLRAFKGRKKSKMKVTSIVLPKAKGGSLFVQSPEDLAGIGKGKKIIVYGAATIAEFNKQVPKAAVKLHDAGEGFYKQPPRFPNDKLTSIVSKSSDVLRVQISSGLIDACAAQSIEIAGVGLDGVCNFGIKQSGKSNKRIVVIVVHKDALQSRYILEIWTFFKRTLLSVKESNISIEEFADPIGNLATELADVMEGYDPSSVEYHLTGNHNFTNVDVFDLVSILNREVNQSYDFGIQPDTNNFDQLSAKSNNLRFLPYESLSFVGPKVGKKAGQKANYKLPIAFLMLGGVTYYLLYQSGISNYEEAIEDHRRESMMIEEIYEKGGAAISLVESRQYFMDELSLQASPFSQTIRRILVALSNLHEQMPDAQPKFESLTFAPSGIESPTADSMEQFQLVLSFSAPNLRTSLALSNDIHNVLSRELNASTRSNDAPRREGQAQASTQRFTLTITGGFNE